MHQSNAHPDNRLLEAPVASARRAARAPHLAVRVALLFAAALVLAFAFLRGSPLVAVVVLMVELVTGYVLSLAWMRPKDEPQERHPKIDELFDDNAP